LLNRINFRGETDDEETRERSLDYSRIVVSQIIHASRARLFAPVFVRVDGLQHVTACYIVSKLSAGILAAAQPLAVEKPQNPER
jgi:hypothetical protein